MTDTEMTLLSELSDAQTHEEIMLAEAKFRVLDGRQAA